MTTEISIGEDKYQVNSLNAMDQFHVFRRVAPLMRGLGEGFASLPPEAMDGSLAELSERDTLRIFGPLMDVLAGMDDANINYIIHKCLAKVQVQVQDGRWTAAMPSPGHFQYENKMNMSVLFRLVIAVLQESGVLGFFTDGPESVSSTVGFPSQ